MKPKTAIFLAVGLSLLIRLILLSGAGDVSYDGYYTLLQMESIQDRGLLLTHTDLAWGGAEYRSLPLFYYLLAFIGMFMSNTLTALIIPNLLISLLPIPVYFLAKEIGKDSQGATVATFASVFLPLLYQETVLTASALTLAIPLFATTVYYFIRIVKTPREQIPFILSLLLLTLTHTIAILFALSLILSLLFFTVQKTPRRRSAIEATVFTVFLVTWAYIIYFRPFIESHGFDLFSGFIFLPQYALTGIGIIPILGSMAIATYFLHQEKNITIHVIVAVALSTLILLFIGGFTYSTGVLILSLMATVLLAPAYSHYTSSMRDSRVPLLPRLFLYFLVIIFVFTSVTTSVAAGIASYKDLPSEEDVLIVEKIHDRYAHPHVLWDAKHGYYLEYNKISSAINEFPASSTRGYNTLEELNGLKDLPTEIRLVEWLNDVHVDIVILEKAHDWPISDRCFPTIVKYSYEVHELRCVVN